MKAYFDTEIKKLLQIILSAFDFKIYSIDFLGEVEANKLSYSSFFYFKKRKHGQYKSDYDLVKEYGMSEDDYDAYTERVDNALIELYDAFIADGQSPWDAIQLSYKDGKLNGKLQYDWLKNDRTPIERRLIWEYESLGLMPEKKTYSAKLLEKYIKENRKKK